MLFVDNLYSQGPIAPICQIMEHLAIWTENRWVGFQTEFIEPVPRSSNFTVDLIATTGVGFLAPNATIAGQLLAIIQSNANELVHFRWYVLDDIEGQIWQLSNMSRFTPRGGQAGVTLFTPVYDPWLATTTFWVVGGQGDKDARIGCTNISGANIGQARIGFFGYRYILKPEPMIHANARYLPAQGR
jgi:hypothetical protein